MERIEVDPGSLEQVARDLSASVDVAREVKKHHARMAAHAENAGHEIVQFAVASFLNRWSYGCGCLVSDADGISAALQKAGVIYLHNDKEAARGTGH